MRKRNKKAQADLDIVIPVYGRGDILLDTIRAIDYPHNLILVDNNSPKDSGVEDVYAEYEDTAKIIRNKTNLGFAAACNAGAWAGSATDILFLNSDCVVQPGAIEATMKEIRTLGVGVVGLKLLFPKKQLHNLDPRIRPLGKIQHAGISVNIRGQIHHPFISWPDNHKKVQALQGKNIWAVTGAYLLTSRNLFRHLRGFDPVYGLGTYEDVDYCLKAHANNLEVRIVVDHFGYHYVGASAEGYQIQYPMNQNKQVFFSRWQNTSQLQWSDWVYL